MDEKKYPEIVVVTKREIAASVVLIAILWIIGLYIAGRIDQYAFDNNEKYDKAIDITEPEKLKYALKTDAGYFFAYGTLKAIGTAEYENYRGYMAIIRYREVKETSVRYESRKCGNSTCREEVRSVKWVYGDSTFYSVD